MVKRPIKMPHSSWVICIVMQRLFQFSISVSFFMMQFADAIEAAE